jgi:uncharacterized membrane protein
MDDLWKLLHVLAAFGLVAGLLGRTIAIGEARRSDDLGRVIALTEAAGRFERLLVQPGSFVVIVLGLVTMWAQGRSLTGDGNGWLLLSLLIYLGIAALVPVVFLPRGRRFGAALDDARAAGRITPELTAAFADPAVKVARTAELLGIVVVIALMVLQPF